jgi:predicted dehydrogenase
VRTHGSELVPEYRPPFPEGERLGIGILGCGAIAQEAHLPAYASFDLDVVGVWSRTAATTATVPERFPFVGRVYATAEELLADPRVQVVDIATRPEQRLQWLAAAVSAGKHVLGQKPLTTDLVSLSPVLADAERRGVRVAVNQNGRWAPAWRLATLLVAAGAIGEVVGVTHLHDKPLPPIAGTRFDEMDHMLVTDYLMHWIDITRCWLAGKQVEAVHAHEHRTPGQAPTANNPWAATIQIHCCDGADALLRVVGDVSTRRPTCPFWIHGAEGTVRGSVLGGSDFVELERRGVSTRYALEGEWFVDGFAGAMGELMCAVVEGREPYHSAAHNVASLRLMLAGRDSVERGGAAVSLDALQL